MMRARSWGEAGGGSTAAAVAVGVCEVFVEHEHLSWVASGAIGEGVWSDLSV